LRRSRRAPPTSSTPAPKRPRPFACRRGRAGLDAPAAPRAPPCPWIDAPAARHARWAAPPANLPAFRGARPSSSSGVLPHPPAGHARTTASTRGHPARRFRLPVVASEDLRLRSFFSLLRSLLRSLLGTVLLLHSQCSLASHFCVCVGCWTQSDLTHYCVPSRTGAKPVGRRVQVGNFV
jgi:hypothetical protein